MSARGTIDVISASAGTGKTYRLTEIVHEALSGGGVQPERVVAVTYTRKAAGELQSRIRRRLLEAGDPLLAGAASRIRDGYVGTIHAICQRLLWEFALDVGLSPSLELLPEAERRLLFRQSLAELGVSPRLLEAATRMELSPEDEVIALVDRARANRLGPEALRASAEQSLSRYLELLPPSEGEADARNRALLSALEDVVPKLEALSGASKAAAERVSVASDLLSEARRQVSGGGLLTPRWSRQVKVHKSLTVKTLSGVVSALLPLLQDHATHPDLERDIRTVVEECLSLAAQAQARFAARKNVARVIDYDDMLALVLPLLEVPRVQAAMRERVQLLLVDEFQDTSPIQLAVIQKLATFAERTVWVGDRKQAIFGFQGSDPELMDSAVTHALGARQPQIQEKSWRSRPPLVALCSAVFAEALAPHGFPREQVVLVPAKPEPRALKDVPFLETWRYAGGRGAKEAHAVARGVKALLEERPPVREGGEDPEAVRGLQRRDVAVLCRSNEHCKAVAAALGEQGIPAVVRLEGLSGTVEAQLCVAALKLLADPRDGVAAATLSWLTGGAGENPDGWLSAEVMALVTWREAKEAAGVEGVGPRLAFEADAAVAAVRAEHGRARTLSPAEALDVCLVAVDLPRWCMSVPQSAQRLANLESLRAAALAFEELCRVRRTACTVAGLVEHLSAQPAARNADGEDVSDAQAMAPAADAVTVLTYHKAKGLEWPVVVLTDLDADPRHWEFGAHVQSPAQFDGGRPLDGRWIRYWPWPWGQQRSGIALADAAAQAPEGDEVRTRELRERARLLYVGFTRARDRLVLVGCEHAKNGMSLTWLDELRDAEGRAVVELPWTAEGLAGAHVRGVKTPFPCLARSFDATAPGESARADERHRWFVPAAREEARVPERVRPSEVVLPEALAAQVVLSSPRRIGSRKPLAVPGDQMGSVGDAVHRFLAADVPGMEAQARRALASRMLDAHGLGMGVAPQTLLSVSDGLRAQLEAEHPGAVWLREWPVRWLLQTPEGPRVMVGEVDLVLDDGEGLVLVDHKSFPGGEAIRDERARAHAGQLCAYAAALEAATGKRVKRAIIHFAVRGELVEVQLPREAFAVWLEGEADRAARAAG